MVEGVRFTHLAVAEHDSGSAAVGLENARTKVDVRNADDHRQAEEDVVEHTGPEEDLIAECNLHAAVRKQARIEPQHQTGKRHDDAEEHQCAVCQTLRRFDMVLRRHMDF